MAPDLLSTIYREIDERLSELRPLLDEREQLLVAADALLKRGAENGSFSEGAEAASADVKTPKSFTKPSTKRSTKSSTKPSVKPSRKPSTKSSTKPKQERAARGAAREAILAALDHGSHTVSELAVVTAMSGPNLNGNLRRLLSEGAVVKTEREGKAAWALAGAAV
ncbi:MAG TPA: helix-turn-helix domain-containing protein [Solirubrobacteraceae bacterium]|jgi:DNA-binding transcriptional ArsR family regulator|nr:helix-turn-helix domain-containing protein [Solirubrobacteraceae bacterium]